MSHAVRRFASILLAVVPALTVAPSAWAVSDEVLRDILVLEQARNTADDRLAGYAEHKDEAVRARAFRALGRIQDPALLPVLARGLSDGKEKVRVEAAFAVGQLFDSTAAVSTLREAYDSEKSVAVRARLIEGLGKCGDSGTVSFLSGLLGSKEPALAHEAAVALGTLGARHVALNGAANDLRLALHSQDPELRWRAAFAVQRGQVHGAVTGLQRAMRDKDSLTLIYACRAAAALKAQALAEPAVPLLKHPDWRVRVEALRVLGACRGKLYTSPASLLLDDPNEHVVLAAIETMGKLPGGGGLARLEELEESTNWRLRGAVLKAKAAGSGDGALVPLSQSIKDPDWRIRFASVEALAEVKSEQALLIMEKMLNDESPQVQAAVVNALVEFPQKHAVEMLHPFLSSGDAAVLTSAANAVGQRVDRDAVPLLTAGYDKLQSPVDADAMSASLEALGNILSPGTDTEPVGTLAPEDSTRAVELLAAAMHDSDPRVTTAASRALERIRGAAIEPVAAPEPAPPPELDVDLALSLAKGDDPIARIVTAKGTIGIRLLAQDAPGTVANFITLVRRGYYNGLTFHRVVPDFVTQGGDPRGDGWGGPGYAIRCEYNPVPYGTGTVGMALSGKDTGGSQFFITHSPQPHLNGRYTVFGEAVEGLDVLDRLQIGDLIDEIRLEGI